MKKLLVFLLVFTLFGCNKEVENKIDENKEVVVNFVDENLKDLIKQELNIEKEDITSFDMKELYSLSISNAEIKNLTGLEYAINLDSLTIMRQNIKSLEPIKDLKKITYFTFSYSTIEELPINLSSNFERLSIIDTQIDDVSFLKDINTLKNLTLTDCNISEIDFKNLNNLESLYLRENSISDISSLKGKNKLEELNLQDNEVLDISPLEGLEKLSYIVLSYNPVTNLKPLESLKNLKELVIYQNHDVKHLIFDQVDKLIEMGVDVSYHR